MAGQTRRYKTSPMTLAEKIFARHMLNEKAEVGVPSVKPGDTGFAQADLRFSHEYVTPMAAIFFERYVGKDAKVNDPSSILFFRDHLTFLDEVISEEKKKLGLLDLATQLKLKQQDFAEKQGIRLHGELKDRKGSEGICHSIVLESYALPGQLNIGSDSHTPHVGAIGCVAFGIGTTDVFNSWITKDVRVKVPESVRIVIRGKKHPNVTAKDFILKILSLDYVRSGKALARVMEYAGEAIEALSVDERATMTNMAAEIGGFTGIVAPDKKAVDFLVERRAVDRQKAEAMIAGLYSDRDAQYAHVIELDAAEITPMVATPATRPSAGVLAIRSSSERRLRWAAIASPPYSTKLPGSIRSAMFSRAVRRPWVCRLATAACRPSSRVSRCRWATSSRSAWVTPARLLPFGKYWRRRPFVFSFEPRCHGLRGSQK